MGIHFIGGSLCYESAPPPPPLLSGENLDIENLKDLLKGAENQNDGLAKKTPRTSKMGTTVKPTVRKETKKTKDRRGMLEVPNLRPNEAKAPKFLFRGRKKRSAQVLV